MVIFSDLLHRACNLCTSEMWHIGRYYTFHRHSFRSLNGLAVIAQLIISCSTRLGCIRMGFIQRKSIALETSRHRKSLHQDSAPSVYYFIDFGLSRQYPSRDVMDEPLRGGDRSAPEHRSQRRCNPFQTDIYYIGNLVRQEFMEVRSAFRGIC